jgi:hypothetical protein
MLSGETYPRGRVVLTALNGVFLSKTRADDRGRFQISARISEHQNEFFIEAASPAGEITADRFAAEIDNIPPVIKFAQAIPSVTSNKAMSLSGGVAGGTSLVLNGQDIPLKPGAEKGLMQFEIQSCKLSPGRNRLLFEASDRAGNRTALEKAVFLDADPPELVHLSFSPDKIVKEQNRDGVIFIRAKDATVMANFLRVSLSVGDDEITAYITRTDGAASSAPNAKNSAKRSKKRKKPELSWAANSAQIPPLKGISDQMPPVNEIQYFEYKGNFSIPPKAEGPIKLKQLTLSDYLGNARELIMDN